MQRRYELIDMVAVVGLCATIAAGGLLFMAANGALVVTLAGPPVSEPLSGRGDGMQWLQPTLGRAIVDLDMLDRRQAVVAPAAMTHLTGVSGEYRRWQNSPYGYLDSIKTSAMWAEANHDTRVQAVMGRAIVQFTRRGLLAVEDVPSAFNRRMIAGTEALGQRMDTEFVANWQPNLGRAIVAASQESTKVVGLRQEQLGGAIVHLTHVQFVYDIAHAALQEQLGGATVVATRVESQMSEPVREPSAQDAMVTAAAPQSWLAIPMTAIVVASLILMSLFSAGLLVSPRLPAGDPDERDRIGPAGLMPHEAV